MFFWEVDDVCVEGNYVGKDGIKIYNGNIGWVEVIIVNLDSFVYCLIL